MNCIECGTEVLLVKKSKVLYDGVRVENVYLRNCEVEMCRHCGTESPVVRNMKKVHLLIGLGIALQPSKVSGNEIRFLRKALRLTLAEWSTRIAIAEGTFSRWENGRSPGGQVEKLARVDFLARLAADLMVIDLPDAISEVMTTELAEKRDFAIVIDVEGLDALPQYESLRSPEFLTPTFAHITGIPLDLTRLTKVKLAGEVSPAFGLIGARICGENYHAGYTIPVTA